jgi:hypothetical protein
MRMLLSTMVITVGLFLAPTLVDAQERLGDGAMGAVAGAIVGGPVGAVAGGVIGYTAGPDIARGMGLRHHRHDRHIADQSKDMRRPEGAR